jgi:hypothetical protein
VAGWLGSGPVTAGQDRRCRTIHPMSERSRDRRCPSGSSLGKALSSARSQQGARRAFGCIRERGRVGLPVTMGETPYPSAWSVGPWFVKPRLASRESSVRAVRLGHGWKRGATRSFRQALGPAWEGGWRAGRAPTLLGGLLPVQRKLDALGRQPRSGLGWFVVVLVGCSGCRGRREASCSAPFGVRNGRSKPARGGEVAGTVAGSS